MGKTLFLYTDDAQLVSSVIAGNESAIAYMFFDHYRPLLYSNYQKVAWNKPIEFEDLLQELFLFVHENDWERLRRYDASYPFASWFSVVSFRFFRNFSRPMIDSSSVLAIDNMNGSKTAFAGVSMTETIMMDLKRVLHKFRPPRDKEILEALLLRDEDPEDVAKKHNVTIDNLYNIKRRALARLAQKLIAYK